MKLKIAPLSGTFMLVSIFGFLFATMFLAQLDGALDWAFSIGFLSVIMFIASIISMTYAPVEDELAIDEHHTQRRKRIKVKGKKKLRLQKPTLKKKTTKKKSTKRK